MVYKVWDLDILFDRRRLSYRELYCNRPCIILQSKTLELFARLAILDLICS